MIYQPMMALLSSRSNAEQQEERDRRDKAGKDKGKQSLTEQYLEQSDAANDPLALAKPEYEAEPQIKRRNPARSDVSPDGFAAVPGLVKPRKGLGRK